MTDGKEGVIELGVMIGGMDSSSALAAFDALSRSFHKAIHAFLLNPNCVGCHSSQGLSFEILGNSIRAHCRRYRYLASPHVTSYFNNHLSLLPCDQLFQTNGHPHREKLS